MSAWFDELWGAVFGSEPSRRRPVFRRHIRISGPVLDWVRDPRRTDVERWGFAELLLKLDSDPISNSLPLLGRDLPPGLRWSGFDGHKVIFEFDPASDRIRVLTCTP